MGLLQDGKWVDAWYDTGKTGGKFERTTTTYRDAVAPGARFPPEPDRYHLFVSYACPWAHRTLILHALKKLDRVIGVTAVEPLMLARGWTFAAPEPVTGATALYEVYQKADPAYSGRVTVPVLWDKKTSTIVNNESSEIIRIFNRSFDAFTDVRHDFYPAMLAGAIDAVNARVYEAVNNGVYRAGFATSQPAYDAAVAALFETLDWLEAKLSAQRWVVGDELTEADIRLFTTLVRFDAVYHGHFKCNWRALHEYPALFGFTRDLFQQPGVADTVDLGQIRTHYYGSHKTINPTGIVPRGPSLDFHAPHGRDGLGLINVK